MNWCPHITVAAIVADGDRFLLVKERETDGSTVINQPAGHLEANESLLDALMRETLEETGWVIEPQAFLSLNLYTSPRNNITYLRSNFIASHLRRDLDGQLDSDIEEVLWLSERELKSSGIALRSPMVLQAIEDFNAGIRFPLSIIRDWPQP